MINNFSPLQLFSLLQFILSTLFSYYDYLVIMIHHYYDYCYHYLLNLDLVLPGINFH